MFYKDNEDLEIGNEIPNPIGYGLKEYGMFDGIGRTQINTGIDRLVQSMRNIIDTPLGSRFFLPSFGSRVYELIFEQNDFILKDLLRYYIKEAVALWEPRVVIEDILIDTSSSSTVCNTMILFKVKDSSLSESFVYSLNREIPDLRR